MAEQLEPAQSFRELVPPAAAGDRVAATELLRALIEHHAAAMAALHAADSRDLWLRLIEFLATGRWQGARPALPLQSDVGRQKLRMRLHVLLTLHHDPASDAAREAALTEALRDRSPEVRACAADLLAERHAANAAELLVRALDDPAPAVRTHAARALGRLADAAAVGPLVGCLSHRSDALAGAAMEALVRLGEVSVPALVEACGSADEWVRWHAARALGRLHDPRAIRGVVELLGDDDPTVRWAAVQALQRQGTAAVEPIVQSLVNRAVTRELADAAGHVLRQVKDPALAAVVRPLGERLRDAYAPVTAPMLAEQTLRELQAQPAGAGGGAEG